MSHPIIPIDLNGCDFQHVQIHWAPAKRYLWVSVHLFLYVNKQSNITYQPMFPTVLMHPGLQNKLKKKNAESQRKFPLPRPSCVHSREKRPDGQWVEISGGPAGLCLLPHIPGSPVRAGLGAPSRTRSLNVKTSGSKDPWTNRNWTGSWQRSWGQLLVSCLFGGENASMT